VPPSPIQSRIVCPGPARIHGQRLMFAAFQLGTAPDNAGKSRKLGNVRAPTEHPRANGAPGPRRPMSLVRGEYPDTRPSSPATVSRVR